MPRYKPPTTNILQFQAFPDVDYPGVEGPLVITSYSGQSGLFIGKGEVQSYLEPIQIARLEDILRRWQSIGDLLDTDIREDKR